MMDRSDDDLLPLITEEDVNKFIMEIWGVTVKMKTSSMFF